MSLLPELSREVLPVLLLSPPVPAPTSSFISTGICSHVTEAKDGSRSCRAKRPGDSPMAPIRVPLCPPRGTGVAALGP
ncbi:hypothetical protein CONLIGDRAFT_280368 [Coniochaeta ligniaria NRRL 30616]|uniref:Uncharacterized protein n=1 Tax=Coniochaeta ligniaria NRRL 30616 TaxID=1408157 RepID=A0A1J7ITI0_9PEZI|nr:hypothetical protein CONLIGDRAFT_280368 [Coniochaeta ligniaria NRRL 30616]